MPFNSTTRNVILGTLGDTNLSPRASMRLVDRTPRMKKTDLQANRVSTRTSFIPFNRLFPFHKFTGGVFSNTRANIPALRNVIIQSSFTRRRPRVIITCLGTILRTGRVFQRSPRNVSTRVRR